jgi:hypothetical protein
MRTTIVALCIIGATLAAQGTPPSTSFCQGNTDGSVACSSCHNSGTNARYLASNTCTSLVTNVVTNCKYYNPAITTTKQATDCLQCSSKTWLNITMTGTVPAITCSDTAAVTATCATSLTNCEQSVCYTSSASATNVACASCSSGYMGSGTVVFAGYPSCITNTLANCDVAFNSTTCSLCKSGYKVAVSGGACVAFTVDSNCRQLGTGNAYCGQCNYDKIFNV